MQIQRPQQKKVKLVPTHLKQKINNLIDSINDAQKARWISDNIFIMQNNIGVQQKIKTTFDMGFRTFIKYLQMVGCRCQKIVQPNHQVAQSYTITISQLRAHQQKSQQILRQLTQNQMVGTDQATITNQPSYEQMSIEVNMQKPQHQLINLQYENQFKEYFMNNFKINVDATNQFVYNAVYKILASRDANRMSPCQIAQLLTQLRDRLFDNHRHVQQCIDNFRHKISTLNNDPQSQTSVNKSSTLGSMNMKVATEMQGEISQYKRQNSK